MSTLTPIPEPLDLDAYLDRIGYRGALAPTREVLEALHVAHVDAVPFENLDILLGRPIRIDLASVQAKIVGARRGGYCFEQNTLFVAVLRRLGFKVTTLFARVWYRRTEMPPRSHMLARVDLPDGPTLADVGFGGPGLREPLRLVAGEVQEQSLDVLRLRHDGSVWMLESKTGEQWQDLYAFTLEEHFPIDYEVANHYTSTYPSSIFVNNLIVSLSSPEGRVMLHNRKLSTARGGESDTVELGEDSLLDVLRERFRLDFPPGTRFSCAGLEG